MMKKKIDAIFEDVRSSDVGEGVDKKFQQFFVQEKRLDTLIEKVRVTEKVDDKIYTMFQRLSRAEQQAMLPGLNMKPMMAVVTVLLVFIGIFGIYTITQDTLTLVALNNQEQETLREARKNMLSNTEHIYSILFQQ